MKIPNKVYDALKWVVMIILPALATLYSDLSGIWGFPYGSEIPSTIMKVAVFLGVCIGVSSYNYKKDKKTVVLNEDLAKEILAFNKNPEAFAANFHEETEEDE